MHDDDEYAELFKKLPGESSSGSSWRDVAAEFEALGKTVGEVLRGAWQGSNGDEGLGQLRSAFESVAEDLNKAAEGTPETQQAREQLMRLVEAIREAAQRAGEEVRPELISLLRQANAELRKVTGNSTDEA